VFFAERVEGGGEGRGALMMAMAMATVVGVSRGVELAGFVGG